MEDLIISYYKQGLYTLDNLQIFVEAGELSKDKYDELSGKNESSASADSASVSSNDSVSGSASTPVNG